MFDQDKWREIFDSLRRHKLRTFLTALAVWWGIFMLVILLGAGNGLSNSFERDFNDDANNAIFIWRGKTSIPYKGLPAGRFISFNNKDYDNLNQLPDVEYKTGRWYFWDEFTIKRKDKVLSYDVRAVHPDHLYLEKTLVQKGRFLNEEDMRLTRKVCVIGQTVADEMFEEGEEPVGDYLDIKGSKYKVIGVFTDDGHENEMRKIYLPISTAQKIYEGTDRIHQLMLTVANPTEARSEMVERQVREQLAVQHQFDPKDEQAIRTFNRFKEYQKFQVVFMAIKAFIWFVGIGSIIAGVIGVSNIMLIVVKDRTKEIGIRKALGATPKSIISMILQEAIFITGVAGYMGLLCGFAVVYGINSLLVDADLDFFHNPEVDFGAVVIALIVLVISGALAGLIPAMQAVKINPVVAMKS